MSRLTSWYRSSGADRPFGNLLAGHGVAMEGYFWRFTQPDRGRTLIALCGVNTAPDGERWATLGMASHPNRMLRTSAHPNASDNPRVLEVTASPAFRADMGEVHMDLGADSRLDVRVDNPVPWPRHSHGASGLFHSVPALNQYWHPWLLGGRASGTATVGDATWDLDGAQVYAEKNWGREGFPESWWWGQAQGFAEPDACVAFAGGMVRAGPLKTEVTVVVVRLPGGRLVRVGDPLISPVRARVTDESWLLQSAGRRYSVRVEGTGRLGDAHVLPVPIPSQRRNIPGAIEHLGARMTVEVRRRGGEIVWAGESVLAALEHGGIDRARAEILRRGGDSDDTDAPPIA
ncbi:tocopherol cyclase family protein [Gordonia sp. NPDC003429]